MACETLRHNCGVMGIWNDDNAAELVYHGLYSLQHRGQESAGIVSADNGRFYRHFGMGTLTQVFSGPDTLAKLKGRSAVGHNRYSTTGSSSQYNIQPLVAELRDGPVAVAHNGNLVNTRKIRRQLQEDGAIFHSTTDSEIVVHLMARSKHDKVRDKLLDAVSQVEGAFSITMLSDHALYAVRDPYGWRPLCIGRNGNGGWAVASETCAFDLLGYEHVCDVQPGEIVTINGDGMEVQQYAKKEKTYHCIFEHVYFSRPDSRIAGDNIDKYRRRMGKRLSEEHSQEDADIVISVPDSSNTAALGYARSSGIKFEMGLIRNHYVGRTFIQPTPAMREMGVRLKFNPVAGVLKDKRVVVVEDSIVRGTTLKKLGILLRKAGAKELHVRVSSPPIRYPCFYGMDFSSHGELIADGKTVDEIREHIDVDSLGYLSVEGLLASVPQGEGVGYCTACFTGDYPTDVTEEVEFESKLRYDSSNGDETKGGEYPA
jgi:amidophosphoribosyltransferase